MQTACLRHMGKKLLVALTMEGKFAGEGLQTIDEDDDMLSAMARELVERNGIGESADAVWKSLNAQHQTLFPKSNAVPIEDPYGAYELNRNESADENARTSSTLVFGQPPLILGRKARGVKPPVPEQPSLFT